MAKVSLRGMWKIYEKDIVAVNDFNLEIGDKEFIVLVGPSGCGKSTTLRMVAGLEDITKGELYIGERLVNDISPKDRDIAMVFQNYALYPHMTVYDNMAFALTLKEEKKEVIEEKVQAAAKILGITELLKRKPKALSGGQRQRVAIGRAIVRDPQVFLMDEPLSNLDTKLRNQMRAEIISLRKRINTTFIYVTHDQTEAMTLGDRIVVMKDGFIQQIGTPREVFHTPANLFVASFIGSPQMNFFEDGKLIKTATGYKLDIFGKEYDVPEDKAEVLSLKGITSCDVTVGIRPEDFVVCDNSDEDGSCIEATLEISEMMGSEAYLHVKIGGQDAVVRSKLLADLEKLEKVNLKVKLEYLHLFDKVTTKNLVMICK